MKIVHFTQILIGISIELYGFIDMLNFELMAIGNLTVYVAIMMYKNDLIKLPTDGKQ